MSEREPEPTLAPLSPTERDMFLRASTSPMDVVQGDVKTYIDTMIRLAMQEIGGSTGFSPPPGFAAVVLKDLSANTGEYVYVDAFGISWLYGNHALVDIADYQALYDEIGFDFSTVPGTDPGGGQFHVPDGRGRSLFFTGTHAAMDRGKNDGVGESSRQVKHQHTDDLTTNDHTHPASPITNPAHTYQRPGLIGVTLGGTNVNAGNFSDASTTPAALSGDTGGVSDNTIAGTVGTGMAGSDAIAHLVIGSLLIAF